jgi:type IV secretory pathway VirB2 component (pilin)
MMKTLSTLAAFARNPLTHAKAQAARAGQQLIAADIDRQVHLAQAGTKANARVQRWRERASTFSVGAALWLLAGSARAGGGADFTTFTTFLTAIVNFMAGPFGKGVVIISIIVAFVTWVFAPKEGIFGPILRVVVAGIAILNATVFFAQFGDGATGFTLE